MSNIRYTLYKMDKSFLWKRLLAVSCFSLAYCLVGLLVFSVAGNFHATDTFMHFVFSDNIFLMSVWPVMLMLNMIDILFLNHTVGLFFSLFYLFAMLLGMLLFLLVSALFDDLIFWATLKFNNEKTLYKK